MDIETYTDSSGLFKPYLIGYYKHSAKKAEERLNIFHINDGEDFIKKCFLSLFKPINNRHVVYFHNLGKFDIHFIIQTLYDLFKDGISITYRNGSILGMTIKYEGVTIYFRDSYRILPQSLASLGKAFKCEVSKGTLPYDFITEKTLNYVGPIPREFGEFPDNYDVKKESISYFIKDLTILYHVISSFTKIIERDYGVAILSIILQKGRYYQLVLGWLIHF